MENKVRLTIYSNFELGNGYRILYTKVYDSIDDITIEEGRHFLNIGTPDGQLFSVRADLVRYFETTVQR